MPCAARRDTALPAAQAMGKERWERFVETLNRRMEFGPKLKNEISEDVIADLGRLAD